MKKLNEDNLKNINGGGINLGSLAAWSAFTAFLIGIIDGLSNPKKCN